MKPQSTPPPPAEEIRFLLSLLRISFPGQTAPRESHLIEELLAAKSSS